MNVKWFLEKKKIYLYIYFYINIISEWFTNELKGIPITEYLFKVSLLR